eukprot:1183785-Prorocentrum_minimum.AAC.4
MVTGGEGRRAAAAPAAGVPRSRRGLPVPPLHLRQEGVALQGVGVGRGRRARVGGAPLGGLPARALGPARGGRLSNHGRGVSARRPITLLGGREHHGRGTNCRFLL